MDHISSLKDRLQEIADSDPYEYGTTFIFAGSTIIEDQVNDALRYDLKLAVLSFSFIFLYTLFHTRAPFLTTFGLFGVLITFPMSCLVHTYVFGGSMSFLNVISLWIILGIGDDNIYVFKDTFDAVPRRDEKGDPLSMAQRIHIAYAKAGSSMLATSFTTFVSFYASTTSKIGPIKEFSFFMGNMTLFNWMLASTYFPSVLVQYNRGGLRSCMGCVNAKEADGSLQLCSHRMRNLIVWLF